MPSFTLGRGIPAFLVAFAALATPSLAQDASSLDPQTREAVSTLLDEMGAVQAVVAGIKASIPLAQASSPELPDEFWDRYTRAILAEVGGLVERLAPIYAERFTLQEIQALTEFYRSPLGKRLVEEQPRMMSESYEIGAAWGEEVAVQVATEMMAGPETNR